MNQPDDRFRSEKENVVKHVISSDLLFFLLFEKNKQKNLSLMINWAEKKEQKVICCFFFR